MCAVDVEGKYFVVVDDEDFSRFAVERLLTKRKAEIISATDGAAAIKAMIEAVTDGKKIEAVITDLNMLPVNGLELLKSIRVGFPGIPRDLPVIMFTALQGFDLVGQAMALDVNAFLPKPVSKKELYSALEDARYEPPEFLQAADYRRIPTPGSADLDNIVKRLGLDGAIVPSLQEKPVEPEIVEAKETEDDEAKTEEELALGPVSVGRILSRDYVAPSGKIVLGLDTKLSKNMINRLSDLRRIEPDLPQNLWVKVEQKKKKS
jgi:CheY-like chemotaxis protein